MLRNLQTAPRVYWGMAVMAVYTFLGVGGDFDGFGILGLSWFVLLFWVVSIAAIVANKIGNPSANNDYNTLIINVLTVGMIFPRWGIESAGPRLGFFMYVMATITMDFIADYMLRDTSIYMLVIFALYIALMGWSAIRTSYNYKDMFLVIIVSIVMGIVSWNALLYGIETAPPFGGHWFALRDNWIITGEGRGEAEYALFNIWIPLAALSLSGCLLFFTYGYYRRG